MPRRGPLRLIVLKDTGGSGGARSRRCLAGDPAGGGERLNDRVGTAGVCMVMVVQVQVHNHKQRLHQRPSLRQQRGADGPFGPVCVCVRPTVAEN